MIKLCTYVQKLISNEKHYFDLYTITNTYTAFHNLHSIIIKVQFPLYCRLLT